MTIEQLREFTLAELNGPKNVVGYPDLSWYPTQVPIHIEGQPIVLRPHGEAKLRKLQAKGK